MPIASLGLESKTIADELRLELCILILELGSALAQAQDVF